MLHIQVPDLFTYHLHVSMPVAQGSSKVRSTAVGKETPVCLCSCTPSEGIHAQVTSQGGGGGSGGVRAGETGVDRGVSETALQGGHWGGGE